MGAQPESDPGYLQQTAAATRELADWFDAKYARPAIAVAHRAWLTRPVLTTFLIILIALSAVPILLFLIFCIAVSVTFIVIGLGIAVVFAGAVIVLTGAVLVCLLVFLVFVAAGLTGFALSTLMSYRFFTNVRANGVRDGATQWIQETRGRVYDKPTQSTANNYPDAKEVQSAELN